MIEKSSNWRIRWTSVTGSRPWEYKKTLHCSARCANTTGEDYTERKGSKCAVSNFTSNFCRWEDRSQPLITRQPISLSQRDTTSLLLLVWKRRFYTFLFSRFGHLLLFTSQLFLSSRRPPCLSEYPIKYCVRPGRLLLIRWGLWNSQLPL